VWVLRSAELLHKAVGGREGSEERSGLREAGLKEAEAASVCLVPIGSHQSASKGDSMMALDNVSIDRVTHPPRFPSPLVLSFSINHFKVELVLFNIFQGLQAQIFPLLRSCRKSESRPPHGQS